ncbi:MAG: carbon-nitrogen hydrolase family protein [Pirellulales bacterium]
MTSSERTICFKLTDFRIAAAQVPSVCGDIDANIATHAGAMAIAANQQVSVLVFPELSLVGYQPGLAAELALTPTDGRLAALAAAARQYQMDIVVGAPLRNAGTKPSLGAILFGADGSTRSYAKMHLGGSEPTYFAPGSAPLSFATRGQTVGIAICADASSPSHPKAYADDGATVYAVGVFLNAEWYVTDSPRLPGYAARHGMLVVMANHAASVGTDASVGKSALWAPGGALLAQAAGTEGCLVIATRTREAWAGEVIRL